MDALELKTLSTDDACQLQKPRSNISSQQRHLVNFLKRTPDYMVIATDTDKVLGAVLIERVAYNKKLWSEHLSDRVAYKEIPLHQIHAHEIQTWRFFSKCQKILPEHELTYVF